MKIVAFKVNPKKIKNKRTRKFNVERILFFSFIFSFTLLIVAQAALMSPSIRAFITVNGETQGEVMSGEEYLYKTGEVKLELLNKDSDQNLKVLVNGDAVGVFINSTYNLKVKDGDVIELDGSEISSPAEVKIVSDSSKIKKESVNKKISISSGVKKLTIIRIE